ncbi:MAG: tetratricopeptide repeat protein [Phycisphaeraceae bacterium]
MKTLALPLFALSTIVALAGCQNSALKGTYLQDTAIDMRSTATIDEVTALYEAGDYQSAYDIGKPIAWDRYRDDRYEAAYITGLSAQALGDLREADKMLNKAMASPDPSLATDAGDALGLVYSQQGRYAEAQRVLLWAAERLKGERQARAYFYAGVAQQKLGQWSQARTTLILARGLSRDATFKAQIDQQVNVTGWTLQVGAFTDRTRARSQAESIAATSRDLRLGLPRLVDGRTGEGEAVTFVHVGQFTSYQSATRYRDTLGTPGVLIRALTP